MAAFVVPPAHADEWNKLTYVTFSQPVQLPNVTLPAGTYTIKLADIWSDRNVVQVYSKDRSKIYGTFLAISDKRLEPTGQPVIMFKESAKGTPRAIQAFFYPGDTYGKAFVYPRHEAQMIAQANHEPVYASDEKMSGESKDTQGEMQGAHVGQVDANGQYQASDGQHAQNEARQAGQSAANAAQATGQAAANAAQGQGQAARNSAERAGQSARNSAAHAGQAASSGARATGSAMNPDRDRTAVGTTGQTAPKATAAPRRLPQTASPLELVELLSALSLAGAFGVRRVRVRLARHD
jgi:hypothetical protein